MWNAITEAATQKPELWLLIVLVVVLTRWFSKQTKEEARRTDTIVTFVDVQNKIAQERADACHDRSDKMMERFIAHSEKSDAQRDEVLKGCNAMLGHCSNVIQSLTGQGKGS